jgi:chromosome segregation ATPase
MEIAETIKKVIQELIVPELNIIKAENREIMAILGLTNKRLDDMSGHLIDQSRRIDETNKRIDDINKRIDDINKRIDETNKRIDEINERIDHLRVELRDEIAKTNMRIDRLYEVIVRREEHEKLESRIARLEQEVSEIRTKIAA